eukprot:CAMPEP_0168833896 /NCGR_PEP_ID=MMETSP0727-20121128/3305_1 /TAXON_ID=265536 /ORGANISM="Amphiprora sp., Strain CCMP467" /LENGTH=132 /DNA_ID=CAMNT_0008887217 /DNA_START=74 /DNA_END=468 /DNA_ORIENTATION=+
MAFGISARQGTALASRRASGAFSNTVLHMSSTSSSTDFAKSEIENNNVVVFSKSYCPFCKNTKSLLNEMNVDYKLYELDQMDNGSDIQAALLDISGQKTVPNVFIKGSHVGGNDKLQAAAKSGGASKDVGLK